MKRNLTPINEIARRTLTISRDEYALCSYVQYRLADPRGRKDGWCDDPKAEIADFVGVSRPGLYKMMDRLVLAGLLEVDAATSYLRVSSLWIDTDSRHILLESVNKVYTQTEAECKQSLQGSVNKVYTECKQSLQPSVNLVTRNIGIVRYKYDKKDRVRKSAPTPSNDFEASAVKDKKEKAPPVAATPPEVSHGSRPRCELHTDLIDALRGYYKANPRQWTDSVQQQCPNLYTNEQLGAFLVAYSEHAFADRNPAATYAQHHAKFCTWVRNQKNFTPKGSPAKAGRGFKAEAAESYTGKRLF